MTRPISHSFHARIRDYTQLFKPRVMVLSIFTAYLGITLSHTNSTVSYTWMVLLFISLGAGAAGCLNMCIEVDIDRSMTRTQNRPLPSGRIPRYKAALLGAIATIVSVVGLAYFSYLVSACLLAFTIFFYVVIYTLLLKPSTCSNVVIGGIAGALPPIVGQAAMIGTVMPNTIIIFLLIFFWTPPHAWALAVARRKDYNLAKIPMLPCVYGIHTTWVNMVYYSLGMICLSIVPILTGTHVIPYTIVCLTLNILWIIKILNLRNRQLNRTVEQAYMSFFYYSIFYLFSLSLTILVFYHLNAFRF